MKLEFTSDTKHRKGYFTGVSFSHPAKLVLPLQLWLIENYTKPGETILDCMSGSGTILVACSMGRNVICVELEQKFINMIHGNWEKVQQRGPQMGYQMGTAEIIHGDARNLEGLLVDKCIFSPPYEASVSVPDSKPEARAERLRKAGYDTKDYQGGTGRNLQQDWKYGNVDKIITSPPYAETGVGDWQTGRAEFQAWVIEQLQTKGYVEWQGKQYTEAQWKAMNHGRLDGRTTKGVHKHPTDGYSDNPTNIGNLKSDNYLSAMYQVYAQCHIVLKPGGLLILVVKNFIRNQKEVDLRADTVKLCESAGFTFQEEHYRLLTQQSFWRTIYKQRYPDAPVIDKEYVLVFRKEE